jgi:uncharacterized caspase-like protein
MTLSWLTPPYRALIVGINEYDAPKSLINPLQGCVADATAIYGFLTQTVGMAATDILLLTSPATDSTRKATRANILVGIQEFLGSAPANSEVLFYYSGHGSFTSLAPEISFGDKQGETLVPADARVNGVLDILDRELRVIRHELAQKGLHLTVIADSCFSGDVMRGDPAPAGEMIPRLTGSAHGGARTLTSLLDGTIALTDITALYEQEDEDSYTLVSGCLPTQQSYEVPLGDTRRGVMTTALLTALEAVGGTLTYAELGRVLSAFVQPKHLEKQLPNITGDVERGIFGTPFPAREKPLFAIHSINPDDSINIRAGLIAGLETGSELRGYGNWSLSILTGKWKVVEAKAHTSTAEPIEGDAKPQPGQPLQLLTRSNAPTVYFDPSAKKIQEAWYEDKKVGIPALVETANTTGATYIVTTDQSDFIARRAGGLIRPSLRRSRQDPRAVYDLARQLNRVATYETFVARRPAPNEAWQLPALNTQGGVQVQIERLEWNGTGTSLTFDSATPLPAKSRLRLTLENQTGQNLWVALYLLDEPYFVAERLYPNDSNFYLPTGTSRTVTWNNNEWGGGIVSLKMFVSSREIKAADAPLFPCGTRDTHRGSDTSRGLKIVDYDTGDDEGWASYEVAYGL